MHTRPAAAQNIKDNQSCYTLAGMEYGLPWFVLSCISHYAASMIRFSGVMNHVTNHKTSNTPMFLTYLHTYSPPTHISWSVTYPLEAKNEVICSTCAWGRCLGYLDISLVLWCTASVDPTWANVTRIVLSFYYLCPSLLQTDPKDIEWLAPS